VAPLAPYACVAIDHAYQHGNYEYANDLQARLTKLARVTSASGVGHLKAALDMVGLYGFLPRSPLPGPSEAERKEIENAIAECGFFRKSEQGQWVERADLIAPEYAD